MSTQRNVKGVLITAAVVLVLLIQALPAQAWGWGREREHRGPYFTHHYVPPGRYVRSLPGEYLRLLVGGMEYFYWEGMFYRMADNQYVVVPAPVGAVVTAIPPGCQPLIVDGVPYYAINGGTYMYTPYGYQVVPPPTVVVTQPPVVGQKAPVNPPPAVNAVGAQGATANTEDAYAVNVPNSKGGYTAVTLKRSGNGFIGPQGEYYTEFPKIDQLKTMYAK